MKKILNAIVALMRKISIGGGIDGVSDRAVERHKRGYELDNRIGRYSPIERPGRTNSIGRSYGSGGRRY